MLIWQEKKYNTWEFQRTLTKRTNHLQKSGSLSLNILPLSLNSTQNVKNRCPAGHVKLCSSRVASLAGGNKVKESKRSYKRSQNTLKKKSKLQITKVQTIKNDKYSVLGRQAGKTQQSWHLLGDSLETNLRWQYKSCCSLPSYS